MEKPRVAVALDELVTAIRLWIRASPRHIWKTDELYEKLKTEKRHGDLAPFGGGGGIVEVDETFIGRLKGAPVKRAFHHKIKVLALVDRDTGKARTMVIENVTAETLLPIVISNVAREARVMTDEHSGYRSLSAHFAGHGTTSHGRGQYVDPADRTIHSNSRAWT